jgi:hypothetical protein
MTTSFHATIERNGKTATGIEVPAGVVAALGAGKKPPVTVTIGDYSYRSSIASMRGRFLISLSAEHREAAGLEAGDEVLVSLELDTAPRVVQPPAELAVVLRNDTAVLAAWNVLSYSNQRRHALAIEGARAPETRARRVEKVVYELTG